MNSSRLPRTPSDWAERSANRLSYATLGLTVVVCLGAVAAALYSQHVKDMQPCPWCILQRVIFLAVGSIALLALLLRLLLHPYRALVDGVAAGFQLLLALSGAAAALYQNQVAAKLPSCDLTLADRLITGLGLDAWQPEVFEVRASCADAAVKLFGLAYELWSMLLFLALAGLALRWLVRSLTR